MATHYLVHPWLRYYYWLCLTYGLEQGTALMLLEAVRQRLLLRA